MYSSAWGMSIPSPVSPPPACRITTMSTSDMSERQRGLKQEEQRLLMKQEPQGPVTNLDLPMLSPGHGGLHKYELEATDDSGYLGLDSPASSLDSSGDDLVPRSESGHRQRKKGSPKVAKVKIQEVLAPVNALLPLVEAQEALRMRRLVQSLMILVMVGSVGFGTFIGGRHSTDTTATPTNGKYQAILFGAQGGELFEGLTITDRETGDLLGGKRAAIQFYHDQINSKDREIDEESQRG